MSYKALYKKGFSSRTSIHKKVRKGWTQTKTWIFLHDLSTSLSACLPFRVLFCSSVCSHDIIQSVCSYINICNVELHHVKCKIFTLSLGQICCIHVFWPLVIPGVAAGPLQSHLAIPVYGTHKGSKVCSQCPSI